MPLHPKAKEFAKNGLFAGLSSFEELEKRIAAIPENKGKGDAFEVFAEAYLATQRKHDAHQVWPLNATPLDVLGKLGLGGMDYGVDGVLQTLLGDLSAYQVKFRTGREPMTWRELSTFMGLADSPHIRSRILITNCDELPQVINERQGFFCIRGSDLDRLEVSDFQAIEAWLAEAAIQAPKKKPLPHQEEALAAIVPTLQKESRATAIMACGTGKTLVTLWSAEQLGARKILVLLPSLALLRQTLHEWLKETSLDPLAYLCVCSDPTVKGDADEISTAQSDLDFEVSTNPEVVRRFLDAPFDGTKIVFSTYQSASVVGEALKPGESFDLGIFDEAHKTAGREGSKLSFALRDENLAIAKRLFVTATPRHYNPRNKNKSGEMEMVYSMDRPEVFGNRVYTLSFSQATKREIICGYKVVISVITSEMVTNEMINRGQVQISGDYVQARQVANQIALRDAVHKFGVERIFTFHNTVQSAASFVSSGNEGVHNHLPEFGAFHVSGAMSTAQREKIMRDFRSSSKGIISNARCLTEGVDVPAVDMVAFLSPRRSLADIVQATGRAMRKSPGKKLGYVLVPLYVEVEAGESIDEAVARADFDEVWDVLQTMQEQDEVLADTIRLSAINSILIEGAVDRPFGELVEVLGPQVHLENIQSSVSAQCIDGLVSKWETHYAELLQFKAIHGHLNVPRDSKDFPMLGSWVDNQRSAKNRGILYVERERLLNQAGFRWSEQQSSWDERYLELLEFKDKHGHTNASPKDPDNPSLGIWINYLRKSFKTGTLDPDKIRKLNEIGFVWDVHEKKWWDRYQELLDFRKIHGHCNVPNQFQDNPVLARWVSTQRSNKSKGLLNQDYGRLLSDIGFEWIASPSENSEAIWSRRFEELQSFKEKNGHCDVPARYNDNRALGAWITEQRSRKRKGTLAPEHEEKLRNLGVSWGKEEKLNTWEDRFRDVLRFRDQHGHCSVPRHFKGDAGLANWATKQRQKKREGTLDSEKVARLTEIGFVWEK
jgi:superfamily II DNA or RNA helicase